MLLRRKKKLRKEKKEARNKRGQRREWEGKGMKGMARELRVREGRW